MGKKIKDHAELPKWFREANYLAADEFTHFDWYVNLRTRRHLYELEWNIDYVDEMMKKGTYPEGSTSELKNDRSNQLQVIRKYLNGPIPKNICLSELGPVFQGDLSITENWLSDPVSRMTVADLYAIMQELPDNVRRKLDRTLDKYSDSDLSWEMSHSESAEVASWMGLSLVEIGSRDSKYPTEYRQGFGALNVDLGVPDDLLEQSFRKFLKTARSEEQASALDVDRKRKLQYQKWVDYGLLPYFDLMTWARDNNRTITSAYAAKALDEFGAIRDPEYRYSAYTIDTTVKKYGELVFSYQISHRLFQAASKEIKRRIQMEAENLDDIEVEIIPEKKS